MCKCKRRAQMPGYQDLVNTAGRGSGLWPESCIDAGRGAGTQQMPENWVKLLHQEPAATLEALLSESRDRAPDAKTSGNPRDHPPPLRLPGPGFHGTKRSDQAALSESLGGRRDSRAAGGLPKPPALAGTLTEPACHQPWHQCQTRVPVLGQLQDRGGAEETPRAPGEEGLSRWATDRRC
uniref:Uncharacterized protein n=1 Tax=Rangifer tarandus platyrhynchus TaxID=3082113 RepID=A0ACB0ER40_RANTA|nr:unnamed protein product [Rangifer tarandus platyrhynchus]